MFKRPPDFIIGNPADPYLLRWWLIPRNKWFNIYLHKILKSDQDFARHDHPWWNISILLREGYWEDTPQGNFWRGAGDFIFRRATALHILRVDPAVGPALSLFITGPVKRTWGFACPQGWRPFTDFVVKTATNSIIGKGCAD